MARVRKQVHGKVYTGGKGDTNAGMTRQAATSEKNHAHQAMMAAGARGRRSRNERGNGKRYCYNGIKGKYPHAEAVVVTPLKVLAGNV